MKTIKLFKKKKLAKSFWEKDGKNTSIKLANACFIHGKKIPFLVSSHFTPVPKNAKKYTKTLKYTRKIHFIYLHSKFLSKQLTASIASS